MSEATQPLSSIAEEYRIASHYWQEKWAEMEKELARLNEINALLERQAQAPPRIYTRCPACHNDTLTINRGHLLCTWHACPDPTRIDPPSVPTP